MQNQTQNLNKVVGQLIKRIYEKQSFNEIKQIHDMKDDYQKSYYWGILIVIYYVKFYDKWQKLMENKGPIIQIKQFLKLKPLIKVVYANTHIGINIQALFYGLQLYLSETTEQLPFKQTIVRQKQLFQYFKVLFKSFVNAYDFSQSNFNNLLSKGKFIANLDILNIQIIAKQIRKNKQYVTYIVVDKNQKNSFVLSIAVKNQTTAQFIIQTGIPDFKKFKNLLQIARLTRQQSNLNNLVKEQSNLNLDESQNINREQLKLKLSQLQARFTIEQINISQVMASKDQLNIKFAESKNITQALIRQQISKIQSFQAQINNYIKNNQKLLVETRNQKNIQISNLRQKIVTSSRVSKQIMQKTQQYVDKITIQMTNLKKKQPQRIQQIRKLDNQINQLSLQMKNLIQNQRQYVSKLKYYQDTLDQLAQNQGKIIRNQQLHQDNITKMKQNQKKINLDQQLFTKQFAHQKKQISQIKQLISKTDRINQQYMKAQESYKQLIEKKIQQMDKNNKIKNIVQQIKEIKQYILKAEQNAQKQKYIQTQRKKQYDQLKERLKKSATAHLKLSQQFQQQINKINKQIASQRNEVYQQQTNYQNLSNKIDKYVSDQLQQNQNFRLNVLNKAHIDKLQKQQMIELLKIQTSDFMNGVQKQLKNLKQAFQQTKLQLPRSLDQRTLSMARQIQINFNHVLENIKQKIGYLEVKNLQLSQQLEENKLFYEKTIFDFKVAIQHKIDEANLRLSQLVSLIQEHGLQLKNSKRNQNQMMRKIDSQQQQIDNLNKKTDQINNGLQQANFRFKYRNDLLFRWKVYGSEKLRNLYKKSMEN